jgi:ATP:corrinoid adenosyltransferase
MPIYLYTGVNRAKAVQRLAMSVAGMQQPAMVVTFGTLDEGELLAYYAQVLPLEVRRIRLPGLGLPLSRTPADEVVVQTALTLLRQIVAGGDYRLVVLDGIREAVSRQLVDVAELHRIVKSASDRTQIAMT